MNNKPKNSRYSKEFKAEAVRTVHAGMFGIGLDEEVVDGAICMHDWKIKKSEFCLYDCRAPSGFWKLFWVFVVGVLSGAGVVIFFMSQLIQG